MKRIRWELVWFVFFTTCLSAFAVMMMLQLSGTIHVSWWLVFAPALVAVFLPAFVVLAALIVEIHKEGVMNDRPE